MRLVCPNCTAQYEVGDDVIPASGRDVQCSNCGHTWFERPAAQQTVRPAVTSVEPEDETPPAAATAAPKPRDLDPEVADILREEAQFEKSARAAEAAPLETQQDLDLSQDPAVPEADTPAQDLPQDTPKPADPPQIRSRETPLRKPPRIDAAISNAIAKEDALPGEAVQPETSLADADRAREAAKLDDGETPERGFRGGFVVTLVLALLALAVYVFAPQISSAVPQTEPALTQYVAWITDIRIWLDTQVQGLMSRVGGGSG